jgi:HD domain protein
MEEKYSSSGYMRLWIPKSPNEESLRQIRETIVNKMQLREVFNQIYERESTK